LGLAAYKTIWITSRKSKAMTPFLSLQSEESDLCTCVHVCVHMCARVCEHASANKQPPLASIAQLDF
jgi:hypothetical protein